MTKSAFNAIQRNVQMARQANRTVIKMKREGADLSFIALAVRIKDNSMQTAREFKSWSI